MATIRAELIKNTNKIRVRNLTDYTSHPNARTILSITDPNGNPISINTDFDSPDMTVGDAVSDEFSFNLVSGSIPEGTYSIAYSVDYDLDDVADDTGTLTFEYDTTDLVSMSIEITYSLADATIESEDTTTYDSRVTLNTRTHTLTYPASRGSTSSSDVDNNTTIALTELYTGEYEAEITSGILIEVSSTYWIYDEISDTQTSIVWSSSGIEDLESSIEELRSRYEASLATDNGTATQLLETAISRVNINWTLYKINRDAGDRDGASTYLNNIADILSADGISIYEPEDASVPVARTYPGYATEWIVKEDSDPDDTSDGRNGDLAFREDNNQAFRKVDGSWTYIGTLGANALIQYSANGTSGWTTTYANGLNYIRFSGDGGSTWENASKFIDGYIYFAYASDASGTDFICTDDPAFSFDASLTYIAIKKFQSSHSGDLVAGDFSGLFSRYHSYQLIQQWSANGTSGWTTTYANGLNYTRFSVDGGSTYSNAVKQIDGYRYVAYASAADGSDFICDDDPTFTFNTSLEYRAEKKFSSSHNGDLTASDFTGLFTRYKGEGIAVSVSNIEVPYNVNTTTYNYTNAKSQIVLRRSGDDLTTDFTYTKDTESNVTAIVGSSTGLVTITNMTDTSGYVDVTASKTGMSDIIIRIYVYRINSGINSINVYSTINSISIHVSSTGGLETYPSGSGRPTIYVIDGITDVTSSWTISIDSTSNITANLVSDNIVDLSNMTDDIAYVDVLCERSGYDDLHTTIWVNKIYDGMAVVDSTSIDNDTIVLNDTWRIEGNDLNITGVNGSWVSAMSTTRIALTDVVLGVLRAYDWDGTDWSLVGNSLSLVGALAVAALSSTRVAVLNVNTTTLLAYDFDGTNWTSVGNSYLLTGINLSAITALDSSSVAILNDNTNKLTKYSFDGTNWSVVGNEYSLSNSLDNIVQLTSSSVATIVGNTLQKYNFDGTDWSTDGNSLALGFSDDICGIAKLGAAKVVIHDSSNQLLKNYEFDDTDWNRVNTNYSTSASSGLNICTLNYPYIVGLDVGDEDLRTYEYGDGRAEVNDGGISGDKLSDSAKGAGTTGSGTTSDPPTNSELTTILGSANLYNEGYHAFIESTGGGGAGNYYFVAKKGTSSSWYYIELIRAL